MNRIVIHPDEFDTLRQKSFYFDALLRFREASGSSMNFNEEGQLILDREAMGLSPQQFQALKKAIYDGYVGNPEMRAFLDDYIGLTDLNNPTLPTQNTVPRSVSMPTPKPPRNTYNFMNAYNDYNNNYTYNLGSIAHNKNAAAIIRNIPIPIYESDTEAALHKNWYKYGKSGLRTRKQNVRKRNATRYASYLRKKLRQQRRRH